MHLPVTLALQLIDDELVAELELGEPDALVLAAEEQDAHEERDDD